MHLKNINIYGKEKCSNKEFLDTIQNVFGDKVHFYEANSDYNKIGQIIAKKY